MWQIKKVMVVKGRILQFLLPLLALISIMYGVTERRKEVVTINLICIWIMIACILIYIKMM